MQRNNPYTVLGAIAGDVIGSVFEFDNTNSLDSATSNQQTKPFDLPACLPTCQHLFAPWRSQTGKLAGSAHAASVSSDTKLARMGHQHPTNLYNYTTNYPTTERSPQDD